MLVSVQAMTNRAGVAAPDLDSAVRKLKPCASAADCSVAKHDSSFANVLPSLNNSSLTGVSSTTGGAGAAAAFLLEPVAAFFGAGVARLAPAARLRPFPTVGVGTDDGIVGNVSLEADATGCV